jgi:uncharacterized protein YkwD
MRALITFIAASMVACSSADGEITTDSTDTGTATSDSIAADDSAATPDTTEAPDSVSPPSDTAVPDTMVEPPPVAGAVYGKKCTTMTADDLEAWEDIAVLRGKAKMGAVDCIDTIQKACSNHANYMQLNGGLSHDEVMGKPGFTGAKFWDRMKAAGFTGPGSAMFEVIHSIGDGHGSILGEAGWVNTLYHRIPFVSYGAKGYGFGNNTGKWATVDFANGGAAPSPTAVSTWPADGDKDIWTTFRCASEIPNPLPGQTYAGYPISVTGASKLTITEHTVSQGAAPIEHVFLTRTSDSTGLIPDTQVYLIPKAPLAKSTRYDVKIKGTVGTAPVDLSFSFTTGIK